MPHRHLTELRDRLDSLLKNVRELESDIKRALDSQSTSKAPGVSAQKRRTSRKKKPNG